MKKRLLLLLCSMACLLCSLPAFAQADIAGTYQGTLAVGKGLRLQLKIVRAPDGTLSSAAYSVDQNGAKLPVKSTTLSGSTLKLDLSAMGASFEGKVAPDFSTITGTYNQGASLPLTLTRVTPETAWVLPEAPKQAPKMPKDAKPGVEVATIKPTPPDTRGFVITVTPDGSLKTSNTSLDALVAFAYGLHQKQVQGAPGWAEEDKYDVVAKPDVPGTPNETQLRGMMQALLADRFGLKFHREQKDLPAFVLTAPKGDDKLKKNASGGDLPGMFFAIHNGVTMNVVNARMEDFTGLMQTAVLDRPVIDKTGLTARYDFQLSFMPDDTMMNGVGMKLPPVPEGQEAAPGLFAAMPQELGLKLEAMKTPVSALVVDHVNKPSDN